MEYCAPGPDSYAEQQSIDHSPAYTWTTSAETYASTYRAHEIHPPVGYQQWAFHQDLAHCTAVTDSSLAPGYELAFDSPSNFSSATINTAQSPLSSPATLEEQNSFFQELARPMTARRGAGRKPRRPYPVIIPNLTKKARGRQVPTKDMPLQPGSGRVFACQVESCRKVFTRSEHLKRHTRSIHTNEKPFRCEEPNCGRLFTRHDNLLQHLKNNRHTAYSDSDCRPLDRVIPSSSDPDSVHGESIPLSPTMGVLVPPSSHANTLSYSRLPMADMEGSSSYDAGSPASCDASSPEGTPAPSDEGCVYDDCYSWQPADVYTMPSSYQYPAAAPPIPLQAITSTAQALTVFAYH